MNLHKFGLYGHLKHVRSPADGQQILGLDVTVGVVLEPAPAR